MNSLAIATPTTEPTSIPASLLTNELQCPNTTPITAQDTVALHSTITTSQSQIYAYGREAARQARQILLPALQEMRTRYVAGETANDQPTWHGYLTSVGINPSTLRTWELNVRRAELTEVENKIRELAAGLPPTPDIDSESWQDLTEEERQEMVDEFEEDEKSIVTETAEEPEDEQSSAPPAPITTPAPTPSAVQAVIDSLEDTGGHTVSSLIPILGPKLKQIVRGWTQVFGVEESVVCRAIHELTEPKAPLTPSSDSPTDSPTGDQPKSPTPTSVPAPKARAPFTYEQGFLTKQETDELRAYFDGLTFHVRKTKWGKEIRRQSIGYIAPTVFNDRKNWGTGREDIKTAPDVLQRFLRKLSAHTGRDINYMSILKYPDGNALIDWHQHREDDWHDSPVWDVSIGPTQRRFWVREIDNPEVKTSVLAEAGSLITLPPEMNTTHQHAILKDKTTGVRYSINCKSLPLFGVWDCHAGKNYPADAVYVGCRVVSRAGDLIRKGTIFGNGTDPLASHDGHLRTEAEFRTYALRKMEDPWFREQVESLRGKHLLCWCVQTGPKRFPFCHARVWMELANMP